MAKPWRSTASGVEIALRLTPRGGRDAIDGVEVVSDGRSILKARVRAVPEDGEANRAVERLIAKTLGVPNSAVRVGAGHTSRIKNIAVDGEPSVLLKKLEKLLVSAERT